MAPWPSTALNVCIYCERRDVRLETEHVFPEGLGGVLKLYKASCRRCAELIHPMEMYCIKNTFEHMRPWLKIKSNRKHKASRRKLVVSRGGGARGTWEIVTEDEFPYALTMLRFDTPGIFRGRPPGEDLIANGAFILKSEVFDDRMRRLGAASTVAFPFVTYYLARFLAKIGHGCAVADRGMGAFHPRLPQFICGDPTVGPAYFVGSDPAEPTYESTAELHSFETKEVDGHLVVSVRLFSRLGGPVYQVVAGPLR